MRKLTEIQDQIKIIEVDLETKIEEFKKHLLAIFHQKFEEIIAINTTDYEEPESVYQCCIIKKKGGEYFFYTNSNNPLFELMKKHHLNKNIYIGCDSYFSSYIGSAVRNRDAQAFMEEIKAENIFIY